MRTETVIDKLRKLDSLKKINVAAFGDSLKFDKHDKTLFF